MLVTHNPSFSLPPIYGYGEEEWRVLPKSLSRDKCARCTPDWTPSRRMLHATAERMHDCLSSTWNMERGLHQWARESSLHVNLGGRWGTKMLLSSWGLPLKMSEFRGLEDKKLYCCCLFPNVDQRGTGSNRPSICGLLKWKPLRTIVGTLPPFL